MGFIPPSPSPPSPQAWQPSTSPSPSPQAWHPSDGSALALLRPWHRVFSPADWEAMLLKSIVPKLAFALQVGKGGEGGSRVLVRLRFISLSYLRFIDQGSPRPYCG